MAASDEVEEYMTHETLLLERSGPVAKIILNRPDARNALSQQMMSELTQAFAAVRDDGAARVLVLTGAGGNFCAGGDLKGMQKSEAAQSGALESTAASNRRFGIFLEQADAFPKPFIALVEGACMGGGVGLLAVADWVIATEDARIGTPEVSVGIVPAQITPFVAQRIGHAHARRLAAFGLRLDAAEAARIGLVHELARDRDDLLAKGAAAINQCLRCAPEAVAATKALLRTAQTKSLGATLDEASHLFAASLAGEAKEGIAAFRDKRKPAWVRTIDKL
ncbi:MAG TPA: enoyl-CoA hydratase-related protein [Hyphomicrobiaceae bacterium]|nr:enoyl-CoA hydratase-related protein [Hyphomicrobiaceae bacterium]